MDADQSPRFQDAEIFESLQRHSNGASVSPRHGRRSQIRSARGIMAQLLATEELFAAKNFVYGTHRFCDPAQTLRRISPHFSSMGITRIADVTGLDTIGIPVCMAVRPNAKSLSVSQGKGLTLALAKVSAAMETIELYHAENVTHPVTTATYRQLGRRAFACDPRRLNLHPSSLYHNDLPIPWVKGFDLMQKREVFVPYDLVRMSGPRGHGRLPCFSVSSNGLASGNHILEAISHAVCEVVERDATFLWELEETELHVDKQHVNLSTVDSPVCRELLTQLEHAGMFACVADQTSAVGIPAFRCEITERCPEGLFSPLGLFGGYGCHLSKEIAFIRAVTEAAQSRLTYIAGTRDDLFRSSYLALQSETQRGLRKQFVSNIRPTADFRQIPSLAADSLDNDVLTQLSLLRKAGFDQVIVVNLTQQRFDIPVVRIIIPDMEFDAEPPLPPRIGRRARKWLRTKKP